MLQPVFNALASWLALNHCFRNCDVLLAVSGLNALSSCSFSLPRNCLLTMSSQIEETVVNVEEPVITAPATPDKQHRKRHTSSTSGKKERKEKKSEKKEKTEKKEKNK